MELALTGHGGVFFARTVSRLKVCQACLLEWVKSMEAVVDSHSSLRFSSRLLVSCSAFTLAMAPGSALVNWSYRCWHSSSLAGIRPLRHPRGMVFFAADRIAEHHALYAVFGSDVGMGSLMDAVLSLSVNFAQSAFRKFHLLTGRVGTELMVVDDSISDGLCWHFGKRLRTRRLAHVPRLAKPRSGYVDVPHRAGRKHEAV